MELNRLLNDFDFEKECDYKNEHYSVRDNGAILRHPRAGKKPRKLDNIWTFGRLNSSTGYLSYGDERVHRIVATAFYGAPPSAEYVVDHIDTNRQNNRPKNLRWVTRLENILLNEITRTKLEHLTGLPIRVIFSNIAILRTFNLPPNLSWMGTVSKEDAEKTLASWETWINKNKFTPNILERPTNVYWLGVYPCCPKEINRDNLLNYYNNLKNGDLFYKSNIFTSYVIQAELTTDNSALYIMCSSLENSVKNWILYKVIYIDHQFEHIYKTFFSREGMEKCYTLKLGREWSGGDTIDDFC